MAEHLTWPQRVIDKKTLSVGYGKSFAAGGWMLALEAAIKFLNAYLAGKSVGLAFTKVDDSSHAHVILELDPNRKQLHGQAMLQTTGEGQREHLQKIVIKLPEKPRISLIDPKARIVGDGVKTCMIVHELIHGIGLDNDFHTSEDVFAEGFQLLPGQLAAGDKIKRDAKSPAMPPVVISGATLDKIVKVWPVPAKP